MGAATCCPRPPPHAMTLVRGPSVLLLFALLKACLSSETWASREWAFGEGPQGGTPLAQLNTHSRVPMAPPLPEWETAIRERLRLNALEKVRV